MKFKGKEINIGDIVLIKLNKPKDYYLIRDDEFVIGFVSEISGCYNSISIIQRSMDLKFEPVNKFTHLFTRALRNIYRGFFYTFKEIRFCDWEIKDIIVISKKHRDYARLDRK